MTTKNSLNEFVRIAKRRAERLAVHADGKVDEAAARIGNGSTDNYDIEELRRWTAARTGYRRVVTHLDDYPGDPLELVLLRMLNDGLIHDDAKWDLMDDYAEATTGAGSGDEVSPDPE